ncbi:MAG: hypothetical protein QW613_01750, partial [Thermoprotei archaeon]
MSHQTKIVDLRDYASKLLSELEQEVTQKKEQIEKLKLEVEELEKQKATIRHILETIEQLSSASKQPGVTVKAEVELPKEKPVQPLKEEQKPEPEAAVEQPKPKPPSNTGDNDVKPIIAQQPQTPQQAQRTIYPRPFNGEKRWEPIVVNNTEYAAYTVSQSTIHLIFKFGVPPDSKYVRGFIIDKYLQKMKEEASERVAKGEIKTGEAFDFEITTNDKGEITDIKILNF